MELSLSSYVGILFIIIEGVKIKYFKDKSLIIVKQGKITKIDINLEIKSDTISYEIEDRKINFENKIKIDDKKII